MSAATMILSCEVVEVIDGNTVVAECDRHDYALDSSPWSQPRTITVRLQEIDAPELDQPYGAQARHALAEMVLKKSSTGVFLSGELDDKGRFLAGMECQGFEPAQAMLYRGLAWRRPEYSRGSYQQVEDGARAERRGLWADPSPVPPWQWRSTRRCISGGHRERSP